MPSSPKFFYPRQSPSALSARRSTFLILFCLLIGISGFVVGIVSLLSPSLGRYSKLEPMTVRVVWDRSSSGRSDSNSGGDRHKVMGFVGIQTGFGSVGRRQSLRKTWMPSDRQELQRLQESTGLTFRFVIGKTKDKSKMTELKKEVATYDDFLMLDIEEEYSNLPYKTPDRLSLLLVKDRPHRQTYIGCMKKGPVFTDPKLKWYEPLSNLLGNEYFLHAYGPIYALSSDVVASLVALKNDSFRMFSNEDVTIGAWMLAMNVNHENNKALCVPQCTPTSIAVWDIPKCSGLCNPEKKLLELHEQEMCSKSSTLPADSDQYLS